MYDSKNVGVLFSCAAGYRGTDCEERCQAGKFGLRCKNDCLCKNGGLCDSVDGTCTCLGHWVGQYCDKREIS